MGTTPQLQLTATLQDFTGVAVANGQLIITLCGFGLTIPKIIGTSVLARVGPVAYPLLNGITTPNIPIWGNDVITPPGTFYTVAVVDNKQNVVQCNMYQFTGSGTIDLSVIPPIIPQPGGSTGLPPLQYASSDLFLFAANYLSQQPLTYAEVVAYCQQFNINRPASFTALPAGTNYVGAPAIQTCSLTRSVYGNFLLGLLYNGIMQRPGIDYTLTGRLIALSYFPYYGDNLYALYVPTSAN